MLFIRVQRALIRRNNKYYLCIILYIKYNDKIMYCVCFKTIFWFCITANLYTHIGNIGTHYTYYIITLINYCRRSVKRNWTSFFCRTSAIKNWRVLPPTTMYPLHWLQRPAKTMQDVNAVLNNFSTKYAKWLQNAVIVNWAV